MPILKRDLPLIKHWSFANMINKQTMEINVLDHGFVKLIDYMGDDHAIVCAARVMEENWRGDADIKLLKYLLKHRHTSPFEQVTLKFHIKAPIFVFRQWHRHRTWSYNEMSARYKQLPEEYYVPKPEHIGIQSASNHQGREFTEEEISDVQLMTSEHIGYTSKQAYETYQMFLDANIPRELARTILPFNMYSEMYATVDLHNLMHFIELRIDKHAQYEIQVYAAALLKCMQEVVPITTNIFVKEVLEKQDG